MVCIMKPCTLIIITSGFTRITHAHLSSPHTQTVMTNHAPLHVCFNHGGYPSISKYYSAANSIAHVPYIDQLTVIKCVSMGGHFNFDDHGITLKVPTEISSKEELNKFKICFARADHNEYTRVGGQPLYDFKLLKEDQRFSLSNEDGSFGVLQTRRCCYLCILASITSETTKLIWQYTVSLESNSLSIMIVLTYSSALLSFYNPALQ